MRKSFIGLVAFAFLLIVGCSREDATPQTTIDDISEEIDTLVIDSTDVNLVQTIWSTCWEVV